MSKPAIGALFDLDGVLIDSESKYTEFWESIDRIYPTGIERFAHVIKGNNLSKIFSTYYDTPRSATMTPDEVKADIERRLDEFEKNAVYPLYAGVPHFLRSLREAGVKVALVTSSGQKKMDSLFAQIDGFRDLFHTVVNGSDVTRSKPDPQGYLMAAERLGCDIADCYVFEDSLQGLKAGMDAGATVIGVATTNPPDVIKDKAHKLIDSIEGFTVDDMLSVQRDR